MSRGMNRGHLNRLRLLEIETTRLRWSVLDLLLDKTIVTRIAGVKYWAFASLFVHWKSA